MYVSKALAIIYHGIKYPHRQQPHISLFAQRLKHSHAQYRRYVDKTVQTYAGISTATTEPSLNCTSDGETLFALLIGSQH